METNEKVLTGDESLQIISEMINRTKVNIRQGSFHLLFWGWLIFFCSLGEYLLVRLTDLRDPWLIWLLVIPGVFVSLIYGYIKGKSSPFHTYADMLYMWTWMGFMIAAIVLFIIISDRIESVAPFILTLAGIPTFISGFIIRFRPLIAGGLSFWALALVSYFAGPAAAPLAVPAAMLTGYLLPGYLLKRKVDHEAV
ncbi:MAG TPA: hypothetical protein PLS58_14525 [Bacteroidales bacterium]|jgi:hypothetical protein|nr:hypothetical protein [Bacteroidales bacterium]